MLRLGNFATTHAKSQKDKAIGEAIDNCDRPAMLDQLPCNLPVLSDAQTLPVLPMPSDYLALVDSPKQLSTSEATTQIAPVFQKIIGYLDGRDWKKDYEIKAGIRDFKDADTPLTEVQTYLQFLELQGFVETRSTQRGALEARTQDKTA
jgi:hypothetical protein